MLELLSGNGLIAGLGAIVLGLLAALGVSIRSNGKKSAEAAELKRQRDRDAEQAERIRRSLEERGKADDTVNRLPTGGAAERLRSEWRRD